MSSRAPNKVAVSPVDAAWLRMDAAENPMVITTLFRFDAPLDEAAIGPQLDRLLEHRRFRMRAVRDALSLTRSSWEVDPGFDVARHVRRARLAAPGDDATLAAYVGRRMSTPLDPARPLWEIDVIDGVGDGAAILVRVHHAVGDGVALVRLLLGVSGAGADRAPVEVGLPRLASARGLRALAAEARARAETLVRMLVLPTDASTPLRGPLGTRKLAAFSGPIPLDRVKAIARATGGHVNDVLSAAIAGALRETLPVPRGVRALVPVFLRGSAADEGNHFGMAYLDLPIDEPTTRGRLERVRAAMDTIKRAPDATVAFVVLGAMGLVSRRLERLGIDLFTRKASMLITNVPGPSGRVRVAGAEVASLVVWAPTSGSIGVGFSLLTYAGELRLGVAADARRVADPAELVAAFHREIDRMHDHAVPRVEAPRPAREQPTAAAP